MSDKAKDTIYIDVEEEITGIVSKVQNSSKDIVALVLPKRASVLQSIVNMKLLKRSAEQSGKKIVLITSESRLLPLAGAVGVFVAANLTSKPYIPPSPKSGENTTPSTDSEDSSIDPDTPVSELAPEAKFADDAQEGMEIDNTKPTTAESKKSAKPSGNKQKVPSFSKFRKRLIFGGAAFVLLVVFLVWAIVFAPKAQVTVRANTKDLALNAEVRANKISGDPNPSEGLVRATVSQIVKDDKETVPATGEKNNGKTAKGSANFNAGECSGDIPRSIPRGSGISYNGLTFITQQTVQFRPDTSSGTNCYWVGDADISAQQAGEKYNANNVSFSVAGRSDVSAQGSANGGTDKIVKVVSGIDIKKARERLNSKQNTTQDDLKQQLEQGGFIAVTDSFKSKDSKYNVSPSENSEADEVTVSSTTTYTMLGINRDDIKKVIEEKVKNEEEGSGQSILSDGINSAEFKILSESDESAVVTVSTTVVVGPEVDEEAIKSQITGKKDGEAEQILNNISGFSDAEVDISPFWATKIPKTSKIELTVQQADGQSIPQ